MTVDALADALGLTEDDRLLFDHAATRSRRLLLAKSGRTPTGPPIDAPRDDSSQRAGAASTRPHNLPLPRDGIVGRNEVIADVVRLIADHRLVSLLGSGGVGKTTVAVAAAAATLQHWRDGAWFVDLTQSTDGTTVPRVIAAALHIGSADDASTSEALVDRLLERRMLLVLDNCEHAIAQVAGISEDIRRACPHVHILATSRETLNVANEIVYRVPSLDVPPPDGDDSVSDASRYASVQLFVDRVRAADNRFTLHDGHVSDVVAICRHLDGIALALELAAARVHVLGVAGVRRGLSTTVDILSTSNRGRSQRQKTVRATIEWSYNLLSESERTFLMRLATFQDGWTLEAAEAVCLDDREYRTSGLELLSSLVDKSLVATRPIDTPRFSLLQTVRELMAEKLDAVPEAAAIRAAHRAYYWDVVEASLPDLYGPAQVDALRRISDEHGNVVAAITSGIAAGALADAASILLAAVHFWFVSGHATEARILLGALLRSGPPALGPSTIAALQCWAASFAWQQGAFDEAQRLDEEALLLRVASGDDRALGDSHFGVGRNAYTAGDFDGAREALRAALSCYERVDEPYGQARTLDFLGLIETVAGRFSEAEERFTASLIAFRRIGDLRGIAWVTYHRSYKALTVGDYALAERLARESLDIRRALDDRRGIVLSLQNMRRALASLGRDDEAASANREAVSLAHRLGLQAELAESLELMAGLAIRRGAAFDGARLLGAADLLRTRMRHPVQPPERDEYERLRTEAREMLGPEAFGKALLDGAQAGVDAGARAAMRLAITDS
jgi:non-specific serine/threonine protein kinase